MKATITATDIEKTTTHLGIGIFVRANIDCCTHHLDVIKTKSIIFNKSFSDKILLTPPPNIYHHGETGQFKFGTHTKKWTLDMPFSYDTLHVHTMRGSETSFFRLLVRIYKSITEIIY